ncbi:hypothetical protein G6024_14550 [Dietzia maris]|nr:phage minor head protein [Dietzia maris]MBB0998290.1 hypothetical protein [Dietzia maris]
MRSLRAQFETQRASVLSKLETVPMPTKGYKRKDWLDDVVDWDEFDAAMARVLAPILLGVVAEFGRLSMEQVNLDPSLFNAFNQSVQEYYNTRSTKVAADINDETEKQLRAALSQGIQAGETSYELRARIEQVFGAALTYRADRIARTEVTRAQAFADIEGWRQSDVVEAKEWHTAQDEMRCVYCADLHGRVVALTANYFDKGTSQIVETTGKDGKPRVMTQVHDYDDVIGPPAHANCRCVLLPVLKDI